MKYFSIGCPDCDCDQPVAMQFEDEGENREAIPFFRSKELAELASLELKAEDGKHPPVVEIEVKIVR